MATKRAKPAKRPKRQTKAQEPRSGMFAQASDMAPRIGRPRFEPTEKDRAFVRQMSALGVSQDDIALTVRIDRNTLAKHFRAEIDDGRIEANSAVAASLFTKATAKVISGATVRAAEVWLKVRAGWVEAHRPKDLTDETSDKEIVSTGGLPERGMKEIPSDANGGPLAVPAAVEKSE